MAGAAALSAPGAATPLAVETLEDVTDMVVARHEQLRARQWIVRGDSKVTGSAVAERASLNGTISIGGSLSAQEVTVDGTLEVAGPVRVERALRTRGLATLGASVSAGLWEAAGTIRVGKEIKVLGMLRASGRVESGDSISCANLDFEGRIRVPGSIQARTVDIRWTGDSRIGVVQSASVRVRAGRGRNRYESFTIDRVEAEEVTLEHVEVGFLRCPAVRLGRHAHVTELEGVVVEQHRTARIGPESHTPPPHGLRF